MKKSKPLLQLTKPKSANPSKRTSCTSSAVYKQVNQKIRQLIEHSLLPYNNKKKQVKPFYKQNKKEQSSMRSTLVRAKSPLQKYVNINTQNSHFEDNIKIKIDKNNFKYKYIIGKGGFGKVWKVENRKTRKVYAMKQMLKAIVMTKKSVESILNQRILLARLSSPFLVNMKYAFQDRQTFYLVLDLMEGGDLRYHLSYKKFTQKQSKFFIASIILGLQYLHKNCILHRDIKPENLVFDEKGYIRITDLGIARIYKINNSSDTSGTPGYMSPQVICRQNHSYCSDYFAVGIIAYEIAMGKRPYNGNSRHQIRQAMLSKQAQIKKNQKPQGWSQESINFINKMIQRKQQNRLGFNGIDEIKNHQWLKQVDWKKLKQKQIKSPFIPNMKKSDFDQDPQITVQNEDQAQMIKNNALLLKKSELQETFKNYDYNGDLKDQQKERKISQNTVRSKEKTTNKKAPKNFINDFIYRKAYTIEVGRKKKESKQKNIMYKQFNF